VSQSLDEARRWPRRRAHPGEGLTFEVLAGGATLVAEAIDFTPQGLGLAVSPEGAAVSPGEPVALRYTGRGASRLPQEAIVRHVARERVGLALVPDAAGGGERRASRRYPCPDALPAFATAACPWLFREQARFRILAIGAGGMTLRLVAAPLLPRAEADFELHLPFAGVARCRGRLTAVRRDELGVAWIDPPRELLHAASRYLLAGDPTLTPAALRAGGLAVRDIEPLVSFECIGLDADLDEVRALRLLSNQADGQMSGQSPDDLRSPYDAHSRHLVCRFGGRIVGCARVNFVDGDPARSEYVSKGGHEVPQWLWDAGFVEGGAAAVHPDFQRAGLYLALVQHVFRVAVQSGHRYVLTAGADQMVEIFRDLGFAPLEERLVEPKPGWRFRSHLVYGDVERIRHARPTTRGVAMLASAIGFAA
jgi:GNAT superfamily N-acetyltransferase